MQSMHLTFAFSEWHAEISSYQDVDLPRWKLQTRTLSNKHLLAAMQTF